jgi:hypothetical protein
METFDLIARKLTYVRCMALNFELGRDFIWPGSRRYYPQGQFPQITEDTARQIFRYIRWNRSSSNGTDHVRPALQSLTISRGSFDRPDKPLLSGRSGIRKRPWARLHTITLKIDVARLETSDIQQHLIVSCQELQELRSVAYESDTLLKSLDDKIKWMAKGIMMGPHYKPESVLQLPGFSDDTPQL